jgi:hypothetical protein
MLDKSNVIRAELVKGRKHKITLHVPFRPDDANLYMEYYTSVAAEFCKMYKCKFAGKLDASFGSMNDGAIIVFFVKEFKPSKKRRYDGFDWGL